MNTPLGTPIRQAKLNLASKSMPLATEFKKLLNEQHQRLSSKHQQDLELIDDIRAYTKSRLSIERDYTSALLKLTKQHSAYISKKFTLLNQSNDGLDGVELAALEGAAPLNEEQAAAGAASSDSKLQKRLANNNCYDQAQEPEQASSLYRVWSEHIQRLAASSRYRADQFEQLVIVVDKLKDIRAHKASIGKKSLDNHLRRIHEDLIASMIDLDKAKKLYYEDESQAKKARENEEKIRKKRSGLLTKFTDLQAKKEKTSAQREANDIQSTQARNDYIMALAAANAHLRQYYFRDLNDFIRIIDDGILDHCKVFMATLGECDINSLKHCLGQTQFWAKMINLTGSQRTNSIFIESSQSSCLWRKNSLPFEACNEDPIQCISLEYNADYALQHEIDKWFTWFKKECRNLSQLMHSLDQCQRAAAEGKKTIELNGQSSEDLESKIIELKQQIRKSEAAKLKAQARLKVIKEGGMQIEEWSAVEQEIRADMARAQELEMEARRAKELASGTCTAAIQEAASENEEITGAKSVDNQQQRLQHNVQLHVSSDTLDEPDSSMHNLASVSRSTSNVQQQQASATDYSALADPSSAWDNEPASVWGSSNYNVVVTDSFGFTNKDKQQADANNNNNISTLLETEAEQQDANRYDLLSTQQQNQQQSVGAGQTTSMTVQSSSPLSAIMDGGGQRSASPYPGAVGEAYKSDYECDYNRTTGQLGASSAGSVGIDNSYANSNNQTPATSKRDADLDSYYDETLQADQKLNQDTSDYNAPEQAESGDVFNWLNRRVVAQYQFDGSNEDDLPFNEGDVLLIIEANDYDWLKAYNELTKCQGFIPTSYVKLLDEGENNEPVSNANGDQFDSVAFEPSTSDYPQDYPRDTEPEGDADAGQAPGARNQDEDASETSFKFEFCRALYDYEPEKEEPEEDGLPHLKLVQGEVLKIVDTDENDGWWLVERESTGERGHVHSILVEEFDPNEEQDEDEDEGEEEEEEVGEREGEGEQGENEGARAEEEAQEELGENDDDPEGDATSSKPMPSFEPPKLSFEVEETRLEEDETTVKKEPSKEAASASQLVPTSFIIIEPTPDVEHRDIEEEIRARLEADENNNNNSNNNNDSQTFDSGSEQDGRRAPGEQETSNRTVIKCHNSVPPSDVCYSVVDEHFAFDESPRPPAAPVSRRQYSDQPNPDCLFDQSNLNPIYKKKADDFSRQIIDQAIGFAYGIPIESDLPHLHK